MPTLRAWDVALAGVRRLRLWPGRQLATLLVFSLVPAWVLVTLGSAAREAVDPNPILSVVAFGAIGAMWRLHAGLVIAFASPTPVRIGARIVVRLVLLGVLDLLLGFVVGVIALVGVDRLDTRAHLDVSDFAFGTLMVLGLATPFVVHAATRGWLGLVTARLVLAGDDLPRAARESAARLAGIRMLAVGVRACASAMPVLLLAMVYGAARMAQQRALSADVLAIGLAIPIGTMLNAACERELHARVERGVDPSAIATVFE